MLLIKPGDCLSASHWRNYIIPKDDLVRMSSQWALLEAATDDYIEGQDERLSEAAALLLRGLADDDGLESRGSEGGSGPAKRRRLAVPQDAAAALRLGQPYPWFLSRLPLPRLLSAYGLSASAPC